MRRNHLRLQVTEKFEDTKRVTRIRKSKNDI